MSAAAVVQAHVDAFNARDLDALMAGFTDDAVWITGTTTIRGHDDLTRFFEVAMVGLLPRLIIEDLVADGDRAACQLTEALTANGEVRTFSIAGFHRIRAPHCAKERHNLRTYQVREFIVLIASRRQAIRRKRTDGVVLKVRLAVRGRNLVHIQQER